MCKDSLITGQKTNAHSLLISNSLPVAECRSTVLTRSLETPLSFYNLQTERDMEARLTSIDFSRRGAEGSRSSWLQTLGNQLIDRSPYTGYTNRNVFGCIISV